MDHADRLPVARLVGGIPPTALVLLGIVSVQIGSAFAKQLFTVAGAAGMVTLRLLMAALVLVAIWRPSLRLDRRTLVTVLTYGAVLATMNLCFYAALARIPLGAAVTIEFLGPLAVAVAGSRRWIDGLWVLLAGTGVVLLTRVQGGLLWTGVLFALAAGACWAAYILVTAKLGSQTTDGKGLALAMVVGTVIALPFGIGSAGTAMLDPVVLAVAILVALMSSVVPYSLELEALRRMPPRVFGILMSLEPAVGAVAGLVLLGEHLAPTQWVAVGCVVIASIGAARSAKPAG
ncbi:EamA family transporter [Lentzea sp. NPDC092896]|uniref:EamA family transporter n=1 Tax=Lentzea sp. NPDC092896 TaxID=3364127 RepID=UPI00381F6A83